MTWCKMGLVIFVTVFAINCAGLEVDACLNLNDLTPISHLAKSYPVIAWGIVALNQLGVVGLAVHLLCRV